MTAEWVHLKLDLATFSDSEFQPYPARCRRDGICFTTLSDIGDITSNRRRIYELNKTCSADIPERGEFYTFQDYLSERFDIPGYDPEAVILAEHSESLVGFTASSMKPQSDSAFNEMTGVLSGYRGQGIALALKLLGIHLAQLRGKRWMRTFHHPQNIAAIAMNLRLGYVREP